MKQRSIIDLNNEQEYTRKTKNIKFFLELPNIGTATVEKIKDINPYIDHWNRDYVADRLSNYKNFLNLLPEEIKNLEDLDDEIVVIFLEDRYPKILIQMQKGKPLLLWFKGNLNLDIGLAVVGSRKIIPETQSVVEHFIKSFKKRMFRLFRV